MRATRTLLRASATAWANSSCEGVEGARGRGHRGRPSKRFLSLRRARSPFGSKPTSYNRHGGRDVLLCVADRNLTNLERAEPMQPLKLQSRDSQQKFAYMGFILRSSGEVEYTASSVGSRFASERKMEQLVARKEDRDGPVCRSRSANHARLQIPAGHHTIQP